MDDQNITRDHAYQLIFCAPFVLYRPLIAIAFKCPKIGLFLSSLLGLSEIATLPDKWIYKTRWAMRRETGLTREMIETVVKKLLELNVIETEIRQIRKSPVTHYRIRFDDFMAFMLDFFNSQLWKTFDISHAGTTHVKADTCGNHTPAHAGTTHVDMREPHISSYIDTSIDTNIYKKEQIEKMTPSKIMKSDMEKLEKLKRTHNLKPAIPFENQYDSSLLSKESMDIISMYQKIGTGLNGEIKLIRLNPHTVGRLAEAEMVQDLESQGIKIKIVR